MDTLELSVIVVTWNAAGTIGDCLSSLAAALAATFAAPAFEVPPFEIIVIDNNSTDGSPDLIAQTFPAVTLVRGTENAGFARANNRAIAIARGHRLLLLNPDAILTDTQTIARLAATLDADPAIAMAGCRLNFADGAHQVGDAGWRLTTRAMVAHGMGLAHLLPGLRALFLVRPDRLSGPIDVDWICGACLMVRADAVQAAGALDERFFLYAEDLEWGCRMRDHGFRVVYDPTFTAVHLGGRSEAQAAPVAGPSTRWLESLLALYVRQRGTRHLALVRAAFATGFLARGAIYYALGLLHAPRRRFHHERARALAAYARAAAGFAPTS